MVPLWRSCVCLALSHHIFQCLHQSLVAKGITLYQMDCMYCTLNISLILSSSSFVHSASTHYKFPVSTRLQAARHASPQSSPSRLYLNNMCVHIQSATMHHSSSEPCPNTSSMQVMQKFPHTATVHTHKPEHCGHHQGLTVPCHPKRASAASSLCCGITPAGPSRHRTRRSRPGRGRRWGRTRCTRCPGSTGRCWPGRSPACMHHAITHLCSPLHHVAAQSCDRCTLNHHPLFSLRMYAATCTHNSVSQR